MTHVLWRLGEEVRLLPEGRHPGGGGVRLRATPLWTVPDQQPPQRGRRRLLRAQHKSERKAARLGAQLAALTLLANKRPGECLRGHVSHERLVLDRHVARQHRRRKQARQHLAAAGELPRVA